MSAAARIRHKHLQHQVTSDVESATRAVLALVTGIAAGSIREEPELLAREIVSIALGAAGHFDLIAECDSLARELEFDRQAFSRVQRIAASHVGR